MKYKAVIADVDGTILAPSEFPASRPSARLVKAVEEVIKRNVVFSIASGRTITWLTELIEGLNLQSPIIVDNGAGLYDCQNKEYIWRTLIAKPDIEKVLAILKTYKNLRVFVIDDDQRLDDPSKITSWKVSKIMVLGISTKKAMHLHLKLKSISTIHVTRTITGHDPVLESILVTNLDATKQVAVGKLLEFLKIKKSEVIGIGDSYNDFPLLMACGLKVAMGNAVPEIKEIADYIAPSFQEDGVAHVIEKFILHKMRNNPLHNLKGEQKDQLLVTVDNLGNKTGLATREECHKGKGRTHLAFMAFILNKDGNLILAKRSGRKSLWEGFWDASVVSHVLPDETVEQAAKRRGKEEMGADLEFRSIGAFHYFSKHGDSSENEYCYCLIGKTPLDLYPNPVEISEIRKIDIVNLSKYNGCK